MLKTAWTKSVVVCLLFVSLLFFCVSAPVYGQAGSTGTVSGLVTDQSDAAIVGADIALIDASTNTSRTTTSNDVGRYIFANVPPGSYILTVTKPGFRMARFSGQAVSVGLTLTVNVKLDLGLVSETVEVTYTPGAELQTMNATVGSTIGFQNLQELPNLSRDVSSLLTLQPAISPNGSVAGAVRDQNTFQLDGGNNSSDMDGTQNTYTPSFASTTTGGGPTGVMPTPVESIEEFKVSVSNQTADFNGSSGAQIQLVTRRGGKSWHGALYEYYLGSNFGANTWLNNHTLTANGRPTPLISNHYNRFGASGGGPVGPSFWGGKTYIFANYEGRRYPQNTQVNKRVPSARLRAGLITDTDDSNKKVYNVNAVPVVDPMNPTGPPIQPAFCPLAVDATTNPKGYCDPRFVGLNPLVKQLWDKYMPMPNDLSAAAGDGFNTQGFLTGLKLPQNDNFGVVRLDHDFGANWHFMSSYRYYHLERFTNNQYDVGGLLGGTFGVATSTAKRPQVPWFLVMGLTTNISHNLTNDFRYNYLRNFWEWTTASATPQLPGLGGAMEIGGETCSALIPYCVRTQDARQRYWNGHDHVFRDDLTLIHGNHLFQFGGQYQRNWDAHKRNDNGLGIMAANVYQIGASSGGSSAVSGLSTANYLPAGFTTTASAKNNYRNFYAQLLGIVTQPQSLYSRKSPDMTLEPFGSPVIARSITPAYNVYFSDTWHMRSNFTLTYGLGYQLEMPPYEVDGKQVLVVDSAGNPIRTEDYLAARKRAALAGQVYDPTLGFATIKNVGGGRKYPYDPFYGGFSPRVAAAWNPRFGSGILGSLFGQSKTVVRAGWGLTYGRMNGVINILTPLLAPGLLQAVSCQGAVNAANAVGGNQCLGDGKATPVTAFRIGTGPGLDGLTAPLPLAAQTIPQPFLPGTLGCSGAGCVSTNYFPKSGDALALDPSYRPSQVQSFDFTIQRELTSKISLEVGYIGRFISHELVDLDINAVPHMTTLDGQSFAQAYAALYTSVCGLNPEPCLPKAYTGGAQPFFERALGGPASAYCTGFSSCAAAVASKRTGNIQNAAVYSMWTALSGDASWTLPRTLPDSPVPGGTACPAGSPVCSQATSLAMSLSNGYGNYHAAFTTLRLRDWHGISGLTNFTWGRALGTGATTQSTSGYTVVDPWDLQAMYGPQFYDIRFLFNAGVVYHLPLFKSQQGVLGRALGGWGIAPLFTAQSGGAQQVDVNSDCQSFGESSCSNSTNENAVLLGSIPGMSSNRNVTATGAGSGGNATGLNAYADPQAVYRQFRRLVLGVDHNGGGGGRIRGFPRWNMDFSITKETKVSERVGVSFYSLMTNFFNHFQPSDPTTDVDTKSQWGVIKGQAYDPRQIEFGLRLHF